MTQKLLFLSHLFYYFSSSFILKNSLYPIHTTAITISANDIAFHMLLSNNITANIPHATLIPYNINTASFCENPLLISL